MKVVGCILGLITILAVRSFLQDRYETVMTSVATGRASNCINMLGSTTRDEDRATYIVGNIKNRCDRAVSQVTVIFKVDGAADAKFNHRDRIFYAYERDVKPGETRTFKTMFAIGKNDTYRFDGINAF